MVIRLQATVAVQLQQANYTSTIMINKLLWYNYGKPCFYSFKGEGKEHKGGTEKLGKEEEEIKRVHQSWV